MTGPHLSVGELDHNWGRSTVPHTETSNNTNEWNNGEARIERNQGWLQRSLLAPIMVLTGLWPTQLDLGRFRCSFRSGWGIRNSESRAQCGVCRIEVEGVGEVRLTIR